MKHYDLIKYIERFALEHKEINHSSDNKGFYLFDSDLIVQDDSTMAYPIMFFNPMAFFLRESDSGHQSREDVGMFSILDSIDHYDGNMDEQLLNLYDRTERIVTDILARIKKEEDDIKRDCINCPAPMIDISRIGIEMIKHPKLSNIYGHTCKFQLYGSGQITYDESQWDRL